MIDAEKKITEAEYLCLEEIKEFINTNGYAPTIRELCTLLNNSSSATVHTKLIHLKDKGYIDYQEKKPRTLRIINE